MSGLGGPFPLRAAPVDRRSRTVRLGPLTLPGRAHELQSARLGTARNLIINGAGTFGGKQ